jgi:hypothetical protein
MANVLTTKEEVKIWCEDTAGTSVFDALLDAIILAVSQRIEIAANRSLFSATYVELHDGGSRKIFPKNPPITSITSIVYAPDMDFVNGVTLGASEYLLDPSDKKNAVYSTFGPFLSGCEALKLTYIGGYISADSVSPVTNIPSFVKSAATIQAVYLFKNRKTIGFDNVQVGEGVLSKVTNRWLLPEVQDAARALRARNIY